MTKHNVNTLGPPGDDPANQEAQPASPAVPGIATTPVPAAKHSLPGKAWTFFRIMNVRLRFIFLMVIIGVVVGNWEDIMNHYDRWRRPAQAADQAPAQDVEYYCAMHPNIIKSEPGNCPICGMPLIKRAKTGKAPLPAGVLGQVQLTPLRMNMGRIGTTPVEYRLLARETRTVGIIDYDETRRATITARVKGRLDKLLVNFTGQSVQQGDPLALIYSPDLLVAQEELLSAVKAQAEQKSAPGPTNDMSQSLVESARKKLLLWGLSEQQVEDIVKRGKVETLVTISSPISGIVTEKKALQGKYVMEGEELYTVADLSTVWLQAKVFESDIAGIQAGTAVEVTSTAYPDEIFAGRITFVAYSVEASTRTVSARVEVANPDGKLKPGMYVAAAIRLPIGKVAELTTAELAASQPSSAPEGHDAAAGAGVQEDARFAVGYYCPIYPDRLFDTPEDCLIDKFPLRRTRVEKVLAVPESAIIDTGARKVAYRQSVPGIFEMVEVQLGPRAGEFYPVTGGLKNGDQVATAGAFLVDAENRLNPAAGAQYFGASGGPQAGGASSGGGHQH